MRKIQAFFGYQSLKTFGGGETLKNLTRLFNFPKSLHLGGSLVHTDHSY